MKTISTIKFFALSLLFVFTLNTTFAADAITKIGATQAEAMQAISSLSSKGYMPVWIDGFNHSTKVANNRGEVQTLFNLIFEKNAGNKEFYALLGMDGSTYQSRFNFYVGQKKMKLVFVESYKDGSGKINYAAIFVKQEGPAFYAYHGMNPAAHQQKFNEMVGKGYRLVCRSTVSTGGKEYVTALYDKANVGSWIAKSSQTLGQTQTIMEQNKAQGRTLSHFDIVQTTTAQLSFGMIFNSVKNSGWYAKNDLSEAQLVAEINNAKQKGYDPVIISGFDKAGLINGNEVYHLRYAAAFVKPAAIGGLVLGQ